MCMRVYAVIERECKAEEQRSYLLELELDPDAALLVFALSNAATSALVCLANMHTKPSDG